MKIHWTILKKAKIRIIISKTEIRHMIADFIYTANFDFTFRFKYIKWKLKYQLTTSYWNSRFFTTVILN